MIYQLVGKFMPSIATGFSREQPWEERRSHTRSKWKCGRQAACLHSSLYIPRRRKGILRRSP